MNAKSLILAAACATVVRAHGLVSGFVTDGKWNQGFLLDYYYQSKNGGNPPDIASWYAENLDNGFVEPNNYGTSDINCHKNAKPGALTASVKAGGTVGFQWTTWPHDIGPVLTYVAACNGDCSKADKTALKWVKIDEAGWDSTSGWASAKLIANNNTWTTTVPSTLAAGNYVFRHEIIALHGGSSKNGAQNYPQCINIAIAGSGTDKPTGTLGVNLYKSDDPGILFNPYTTFSSYKIPGPALYRSGSGSNPGPSTTTRADATTTTFKTSTATKASTTTTAASPGQTGSGAALYGQCGGIGWTGATTCAQGTCKTLNDYYSQCVP
ncbi:family 61 glycoside hydrolase [Xylaria bambusicola]|uniref:family 61 glycoside hydrolase n=1 Tax=Xylaria bambusicola TaxID=326684 RepID=UPI0020086C06|nr:family 61 glycoside hydrolase [Xylaria bambusicola]KAI0515162.1 family 61 glycoside hydrolase [Xylaria bambusicola]